MLKLIEIGPDFYEAEPQVTLLDLNYSSGLVKKAADDRIKDYVKSLSPRSDRIYVHILAMGAGEYFGANRNADYFPEDNLLQYYQTFETSPAHIFQHHINKDPSIAIGQVVYAIYNERMHRVEVIAWIDKVKGAPIVAKIEAGQFPATSMACHTPFDTCSICGNKARTREAYCVHLRNELGKIYPDGRKVMAINDGALKFFDMSIVFRPADATSSVLQKLASSNAPVISSLELAEMEGLTEKSAAVKSANLKKLADIIKEVEGQVVGFGPSAKHILDRVRDPDDDVLEFLVHYEMDHVLHALAELGISPSIEFFAKMISKKLAGEGAEEVHLLVSNLVKDRPQDIPVQDVIRPTMEPARAAILSKLLPFVKQASIFPTSIQERSLMGEFTENGVTYGPATTGYARLDEPMRGDAKAAYMRLKESAKADQHSSGMLKTLFTIAGMAIAAKWLLSRMIENKMKELQQNSPTPTKIVLVKTAEEAMTAERLVKASFLRSVQAL